MSDWAAIEREEARVADKLTETTAKLHEMLARQSRLMKQQQFVRTRAKEMLQQGLDNLDKLDAVEAEEQKAVEASASTTRTSISSDPLTMDPAAFD
ncbi:hypothetical protein V494_00037 [Pseudogymnoascus sp. VKM F-4513 (FW-928)]|nr:hypothetical protein V494_00037 [Pseudogymnoascus sp. VKM F-4513 (FW-928)]